MKITPNGTETLRSTTRAGQGDARVRSTTSESTTAGAGSTEGSISLSAASRETLASDAPFNAKQVAEIQQAIRDGKFKVNAEAVAEKFMQFERDFGTIS